MISCFVLLNLMLLNQSKSTAVAIVNSSSKHDFISTPETLHYLLFRHLTKNYLETKLANAYTVSEKGTSYTTNTFSKYFH